MTVTANDTGIYADIEIEICQVMIDRASVSPMPMTLITFFFEGSGYLLRIVTQCRQRLFKIDVAHLTLSFELWIESGEDGTAHRNIYFYHKLKTFHSETSCAWPHSFEKVIAGFTIYIANPLYFVDATHR
jgi:hypothetical protein